MIADSCALFFMKAGALPVLLVILFTAWNRDRNKESAQGSWGVTDCYMVWYSDGKSKLARNWENIHEEKFFKSWMWMVLQRELRIKNLEKCWGLERAQAGLQIAVLPRLALHSRFSAPMGKVLSWQGCVTIPKVHLMA